MTSNGYSNETQEAVEPEFVVVTSGDFEIPVEEDGTLLLTLIRAQLPGASGLWYWSNDKRRKKAIRFDRTTNRLFPPLGGWSDRTYNVAYSDILQSGILGTRELERYEVATKLFQESVESISRLSNYDTFASSLAKKDEMLDEMKKENENLKAKLANAVYTMAPGSAAGKPCQKCPVLEADVKIKEIELTETRDFSVHLETQLAQRNDKINELTNKCQEYERFMNSKNKEMDLAKASMERLKKELELVSGSAGGLQLGKLDSALAEEAKSLKKQLDDSKWRCGELEATLSSKSREAGALHDWKREAENNLSRLNAEHGACLVRREKLEATIHALHQFALLMKKEAENAKKRSGLIGAERKFGDKLSKDEMAEILQRFENDLDTTRESLRKQTDELENLKWKYSELEATLAVKDNEIRFLTEESANKEQTLINEIDSLKLELEAGKEDSEPEPEAVHADSRYDILQMADDEEEISSVDDHIATAPQIFSDEAEEVFE